MQTIHYTGELWEGDAVHPALWSLLLQKDLLIDIQSGQPPYDVLLGVPHHAAPHVSKIANRWVNPKTGKTGRAADETTGLSGLVFLSALREKKISARLLIAAHPMDHDPNKTPDCPYWQHIFQEPLPGLLLELHGAASHRRHALELSAGQNTIADPLTFGKILAYFFNNEAILAVQEKPGAIDARVFKGHQGTGGRLQNPAIETTSLARAGELGRPALHLEMKTIYRQPDPTANGAARPTSEAWKLARAVANAIDLQKRSNAPVWISAAALGLPSTAVLTRPSMEYAQAYLDAVKEASFGEMQSNPEFRIWNLSEAASFIQYCQQVDFWNLPENPPEEYLWLVDRGEVIGSLFILHWLDQYRLENDGLVDYWVRSSKRLQGYGRLILRLALERFRQLGLDQVLITCREDNAGSRKIIEANGGIYESSIPNYGHPTDKRRRYWIPLKLS